MTNAGSPLRDVLELAFSADVRWSEGEARQWKARLPWLVGCNFTPAYAINPIEMWAADTFDAVAIDRELGWAADLGMNTARVYLHNVPWAEDREGFLVRVQTYLDIAHSHGIHTMLVLFDSCWHPEPMPGRQPDPRPGVHNSGWVQCPGVSTLMDVERHNALRDYVRDIVGEFAFDPRVLAWDIWNEPDNDLDVSACKPDELNAKAALVLPLLREAFNWARGMNPIQPLTSGIWLGDWSSEGTMTEIQIAQCNLSDIISFHNYAPGPDFAKRIGWLRRYNRPLICSEFMARPTGSTFEDILPIAQAEDVGAICWGLVAGRSQTQYSWSSWKQPDAADAEWFHDVLHPDGTPYDAAEAAFISEMATLHRRKAA